MTATYNCIATTTLTTSQSTIEFTSIPGTYTDLVLISAASVSSGGGDIWIRANSDSGSNYSYTTLFGYPGTIGGGKDYSLGQGLLTDYYGAPKADFKHVMICNFPNYANTNRYKIMLSRANSGADDSSAGVDMNIALWKSTAAITSLLLRFNSSQTFPSGTTASLYGIKCE